MIDLLTRGRFHSCDGISRRGVLRIGTLGLGSMTLPDALRRRATLGADAPSARAVIQVILGGGPSPFETFDPKPDAPGGIRSEVGAIATALPGVGLAETMPRLARVLDRAALIRGIAHESSDHTIGLHRIMTGYAAERPGDRAERPSVGSVVARVRGAGGAGLPPYVALSGRSSFDGRFLGGAYLGPAARPFEFDADPDAGDPSRRLAPAPGLSADRLRDRRSLLGDLDRLRRASDAPDGPAARDRFVASAFDLIAGPAAHRALDLGAEPPAVRGRYGESRIGRSCLLARRLVEAGVGFVTITEGDWDHHSQVGASCRKQAPPVDAALAALIADLAERGLAGSVLVVVMGEFGRTPRINGAGGRDHWPGAMTALVAGGGLRMGQVVGATDAHGEHPVGTPWRPEDLLRTIYRVVGIDPAPTFPDEFGRPLPILDRGRVIADLL